MRIGIIGGLGPEATIEYYRIIVHRYRQETGRFPYIIIDSLDMSEFSCLCKKDLDRQATLTWLLDALKRLERAGADVAVIASNTPHIVFDELEKRSPLPMISIVEQTCREAAARGLKKLGLLGTQVTMSADFYHKKFAARHIDVVVPMKHEQDFIQEKLSTEIMFNIVTDATRKEFTAIIQRMIARDAIDGVILGCTELPLILTDEDCDIPLLNTSRIHAESVVQYCVRYSRSTK